MKSKSIEDEEIQIKDLIYKVLNTDIPFKDKYLEKVFLNILDPKNKFIVRGYCDDGKIKHKESFDFRNINSMDYNVGFFGYNFSKLKLQIRLENDSDVIELMKFLQTILPSLSKKTESEEESINNDRRRKLEKILYNYPDIPKIKLNI